MSPTPPRFLHRLSLLALLTAFACSDLVAPVDETDDSGKADGFLLPAGTYNDFQGPGRTLVLLSDDRFLFWDACGQSDSFFECDELEVEGTYRLTHGGSSRFITLASDDEGFFERLRYQYAEGELLLRPASQDISSLLPDRWTTFEQALEDAYCKDATWCELQGLPGDITWDCNHQQCAPSEEELVVECLNEPRSFSVTRVGDDTYLGFFQDFGSVEPVTYECVLWDRGTIRYRCYGDADGEPVFHQINVLRFASGTPAVEFNLVSQRNEPGGGDVLFSFSCEAGSTLDF